jgi:CRISPR-associated protein Csx14
MSSTPTSVCIATLGGQPQVVTLALDALLARGELVGEVIVVHLSERNPRYRAALAALAGEFAGDRYRGQTCRYRPLAVTQGHVPVEDLASEAATGAALNTFSRLIQRLKRQDRAIHLCLSGGRRLLGMLAMSAIQLYGDHADQIWHLYSSDAVRERTADGAALHLPVSPDVRLVRVPILPLGQYFPWMRPPDGATPSIYSQAREIDAAEHTRCRQVVEQLTPSRQAVLRAIASGLTPQEAAAELKVEISTIHAHKTPIFEFCRIAWDLAPDAPLDYRWLREKFRTYFES